MRAEVKSLLRKHFPWFARKAHGALHAGAKLGDEPYIDYLCAELVKVARADTKRLVINFPPGHAKTFLGSICLSAWTLAHRPSAKIIIVTCGEQLAKDIAYKVRTILREPWFMEVFGTRVAQDRRTVLDFATTDGGALFATSFAGGITGRRADLIIVDDPLEIGDASNIDRIERVNELFDTVLVSRLNYPKKGGIVIIAHRLHEHDLSGHVLAEEGEDWRHVVLPLSATRDRTYDTGRGKWRRKKGELLRPDAFSPRDLDRLRRTTVNPDFETLYQQDPSGGISFRINAKDFTTFAANDVPDAPVVLSVDPGQSGGSNNSCGVIQAWTVAGEEYFLLDQWRRQSRYAEFRSACQMFIRRRRPSVILIEATGQGPALLSDIKPRKWMRVDAIVPDGRSKTARLREHVPLIRSRRIRLPEGALWREDFVDEVTDFPSGRFDDQVDAMTQFLDWIIANPRLEKPPALAVCRAVDAHFRLIQPTARPIFMGVRGVVVVGRSMRW
jgi:predicted phage terminase large subunit-like protein